MSFLKVFLIILLLLTFSVSAQTDWVKWGKAEVGYEKPNQFSHRDYSFKEGTVPEIAVKAMTNAYWFFISDLDGDNCPFRPTCSSFLIQSVKATNLVQGTLMFFDRFTRDFNIVDRNKHYPRVEDGHYYDPVTLYSLNEDKIKYIPPSAVIEK